MDAGLEAVIAAETILSDVNGLEGQLIIRGHSLDQLVQTARFEDVLALLWHDFFETNLTSAVIGKRLGLARLAAFERLNLVPKINAIETLRIGYCLCPDGDDLHQALALVATSAVVILIRQILI